MDSIIPRSSGGILPLSEALDRYPTLGIVFYNRVSSWGAAGKGKVKLEAKTTAAYKEFRELTPRRLKRIAKGVEEGKLSKKRPKLKEAAKVAKAKGCLIVAPDLSRFLRSEEYDNRTNREAWPTEEEFEALRELTLGVPLATVLDPFASESERHSLANLRRSAKPGPPKEPLDPKLALKILDALGYPSNLFGRVEWETPMSKVAKMFGITKVKLQRFLDEEFSWLKGLRLKDVPDPARAYRVAMKMGKV